MKRSGLTGAVAEKNHGDLLVFSFFRGEGRAEGERDRAADHAGGGDEAAFFGDDMHGAAFAAAVAGGAAGDLGHQPVDVRAFGDGVTVRAMTAVNVIVLRSKLQTPTATAS